jgi:hypothetical protein
VEIVIVDHRRSRECHTQNGKIRELHIPVVSALGARIDDILVAVFGGDVGGEIKN